MKIISQPVLKPILLSFAVVAVAVFPAFAAEMSATDMKETKQYSATKMEMMKNPHHVLARAYRMNLITFGKSLKKVAELGETVPQDFARISIDEMKRSAEQMEKHHTEFVQAMPEDMKAKMGEMPKMKGQHMADVKTHLGHLDELAKSDRVVSEDVIKHVDLLLKECEGMDMEGMEKMRHPQ